jgi:O-antigen biosynthesis protein WbqV
MVRYFMTIREACDLVITAATHALTSVNPDVSIYVLNMGQPVRIIELAERLIELSGLQVGQDIDIIFSGMRPGERLNELLFTSHEPTIEIGVPGIMAAKPHQPSMQAIRSWIDMLNTAIANDDCAMIRSILVNAEPEFDRSSQSPASAIDDPKT